MASFRRPSQRVTAVVLALAEQPATWRYASELCRRLDLDAEPPRQPTPARAVGGIGRRPRLEGT